MGAAGGITRCWGAGFSLHVTLLTTLLFAGPLALAASLGLPWRRAVAAVLLLIVIPAIVAEAQATLEEQLFVASGATTKLRRWWPAGSSYLEYNPATGQLTGGD